MKMRQKNRPHASVWKVKVKLPMRHKNHLYVSLGNKLIVTIDILCERMED